MEGPDSPTVLSGYHLWKLCLGLSLGTAVPGLLPLALLLTSAMCALSTEPVPCSLQVQNSLAFAKLLLTRWVLLSFHIPLLFIYFYPQAYSMCTIVWIVMNFGLNSGSSKACFQLNKPNELKSFSPFLLYSHYPSQQGGWVKNASSRSWKNF